MMDTIRKHQEQTVFKHAMLAKSHDQLISNFKNNKN